MSVENDSQKKVFIVEDDSLISEVLSTMFNKKNWSVQSVIDGEAALDKISNDKPDIVLLDILLPGISGHEVLEKLKSNPDTKDIPVLVLSNYGQQDEIERSFELGAVDHLVKANVVIDNIELFAQQILAGTYVSTTNPHTEL